MPTIDDLKAMGIDVQRVREPGHPTIVTAQAGPGERLNARQRRTLKASGFKYCARRQQWVQINRKGC
jgi:hypothetical protein